MSYTSSNGLNKKIDALPSFCPKFRREEVTVDGENFEIFHRNILDCIAEIYGRHDLTPHLKFKPERHYADADMTIRIYGDMHTGKWWWGVQVSANPRTAALISAHLNLRKPLRRKPPAQQSSQSTSHPTRRSLHRSWGNQYIPCMSQSGMFRRKYAESRQNTPKSSSHTFQLHVSTTWSVNPASAAQVRICSMPVCGVFFVLWKKQGQRVCG